MATITEDEIYRIRTDILCNYFGATKDSNIKKLVAEFLLYKRKGKETSELYLEFLSRHPVDKELILSKLQDRDKWESENFLTAKCVRSMVSQLLRWPDTIHDGPFNWNEYYFFGLDDEHVSPANGVILNQPVEVCFRSDREFFTKFFIFMFEKDEQPDKFLAYHRINTFANDTKEYRLFLKDCLDHLTIRKAFLKQWIKDELNGKIEIRSAATPPQNGQTIKHEYTQKQIALHIYYKQAAGSMALFEEGEKEKQIQAIATLFNKESWKPLRTDYNRFIESQPDRLKALHQLDNFIQVQRLLEGDENAMIKLKKEYQLPQGTP